MSCVCLATSTGCRKDTGLIWTTNMKTQEGCCNALPHPQVIQDLGKFTVIRKVLSVALRLSVEFLLLYSVDHATLNKSWSQIDDFKLWQEAHSPSTSCTVASNLHKKVPRKSRTFQPISWTLSRSGLPRALRRIQSTQWATCPLSKCVRSLCPF